MAESPTTRHTPRTLRSRLAAGALALGLLGGTLGVGAVVWHDIEQHSSTEAAGSGTSAP
ncbi:hypothetical protein Q0F99_15455 [Rathayibacter oskolensis]|uniref:hypothetical protein n=1 Tax=Rathayibacter oskolensis TaxID=1891671 RepID=UPI00265F62D6|nr:hypothetical protein [Rathayibacter oskolensis]WKK71032.1 hypothetical protein Q0F99_15455 [Rathayibacter oskolensis]